MMNRKAKGTRNEHKTIRRLESIGYECFRMAGSLGLFDVIGVSAIDLMLVQVKSNRNPSRAELDRIRELDTPESCRKVIHVWKDRQSLPEIREVKGQSNVK
ncbi:MAG: hypothetical protein WBD22_06445 [Pyrinomonadaceae bacterium]